MRQLCANGFSKVHLAVGYKADEVAEFVRNCDVEIEINVVQEESPLGTGGARKHAAKSVTDQHFMVLNGDSYNKIDFAEVFSRHIKSGFSVSILTTWVSDASRFGTVELAATGKIESFREKTGIHEEGLINAGVYCFRSDALHQMSSDAFSIEDYFGANVDQIHLQSIMSFGDFSDIGTPEDFKIFNSKTFEDFKDFEPEPPPSKSPTPKNFEDFRDFKDSGEVAPCS